jgi:hypothetical protein
MVEAQEKLLQEEKDRRLKQFQANVQKRAQLIRRSQAKALHDLSQNATRFEAEAIKMTAHPNATIRAPQVGLTSCPLLDFIPCPSSCRYSRDCIENCLLLSSI